LRRHGSMFTLCSCINTATSMLHFTNVVGGSCQHSTFIRDVALRSVVCESLVSGVCIQRACSTVLVCCPIIEHPFFAISSVSSLRKSPRVVCYAALQQRIDENCQHSAIPIEAICSLSSNKFFFFWTANILLIKTKSSHKTNKDRSKRNYKTKVPYIGGTPVKNPKQTLPNRGPTLIPFLERHSSASSTTRKFTNPTQKDFPRL
jgi:hypothetical protein